MRISDLLNRMRMRKNQGPEIGMKIKDLDLDDGIEKGIRDQNSGSGI